MVQGNLWRRSYLVLQCCYSNCIGVQPEGHLCKSLMRLNPSLVLRPLEGGYLRLWRADIAVRVGGRQRHRYQQLLLVVRILWKKRLQRRNGEEKST